MIFASAGHNSKSKTIKQDSGAVANGYKEGDLTIDFRDLVCAHLDIMGAKYIKDYDEESLAMYLSRIKTGSGSVVIEYHFDASDSNQKATGTTAIVEEECNKYDIDFATEISASTSLILGIKNRGVIKESESYRGRLGLMREEGIICLCELCFITNKNDLDKYFQNRYTLAKKHAQLLVKYDSLLS